VRDAAEHVLALKFKLGLFEHPYVNAAAADDILGADTALARRAAAESSVLLRNENSALPLPASAKVVVTGPAADSVADTLGGWSVGWQGVPAGSTEDAVTVREGLQNAGGSNVTYAASTSDAVSDAAGADAIVAVLGRGPGAEGPNDQRDPTLPADQQALVKTLMATGKPVIVVLLGDRPDVLGDAANADAILAAWRPGTEGGDGVADLLYGKADPSGRLPVSWPARATDQPNTYLYATMPNTYNGNGSPYQPAWPFGYGLSYTTTSQTVTAVHARAGSVAVQVKVDNTGSRDADVVVPVYVSQPGSPVLLPAKRLAGFARVSVAAGSSETVTVRVPLRNLGVVQGDVDASGPPTLQHGQYVFSTGALTDAGAASAGNSVTL
jgi:beta-glucosidase